MIDQEKGLSFMLNFFVYLDPGIWTYYLYLTLHLFTEPPRFLAFSRFFSNQHFQTKSQRNTGTSVVLIEARTKLKTSAANCYCRLSG